MSINYNQQIWKYRNKIQTGFRVYDYDYYAYAREHTYILYEYVWRVFYLYIVRFLILLMKSTSGAKHFAV